MNVKPETALTTSDWQLVHKYRNCRAQLRKKRLSDKLRARLPVLLAGLEDEARDRGIATYLGGWRKYPDRDRPFAFGASVDIATGAVTHTVPVEQKRKPKPAPMPPATPPDELIDALERSLELAKR